MIPQLVKGPDSRLSSNRTPQLRRSLNRSKVSWSHAEYDGAPEFGQLESGSVHDATRRPIDRRRSNSKGASLLRNSTTASERPTSSTSTSLAYPGCPTSNCFLITTLLRGGLGWLSTIVRSGVVSSGECLTRCRRASHRDRSACSGVRSRAAGARMCAQPRNSQSHEMLGREILVSMTHQSHLHRYEAVAL
jgi:hypothetical protein